MKTIKMIAAVAVLVAAFTISASAQLGRPAVLWSTAAGTVTEGVTNAKVAYNVTSTPNKVIDCTGGKELFLQVRFQYTTTSIPATNTAMVFSCSAEPNAVGSTNRHVMTWMNWTVAGSTTDTGYATYTTNFSVLGRPYIYLDSVLPLAPLTNFTIKYVVK